MPSAVVDGGQTSRATGKLPPLELMTCEMSVLTAVSSATGSPAPAVGECSGGREARMPVQSQDVQGVVSQSRGFQK